MNSSLLDVLTSRVYHVTLFASARDLNEAKQLPWHWRPMTNTQSTMENTLPRSRPKNGCG